jgi:manganese/iron transport system ATP-binding protein/manganese/zinc/iron transport system ATP- binding protein
MSEKEKQLMSHRLEIKNLTISYHRLPAVHHLNLEIHCGNCVALLGPNGAGKTTLFKAIVGQLPSETGSVVFHGHGARAGEMPVTYLPQRSQIDWDFPLTVRGLVEMGRFRKLGWWRRFGEADRLAVDAALATMHLSDFADRQICALSGGQQQRAFLARSLAQEAHVFLLDEPFAGLDKRSQDALGQTLRDLAAQGNLVIASHHDLKNVTDLFNQIIFLNGELIAFGDTAEVFTPENIAKTYTMEAFSGVTHHDDLVN